ncbi:MAG: YqeG family HAD IIIA-type phosphatase [Oscillospiraceae bacterium]|nr:YqeG family HAD IIIA-type phosphatase [Oscillospiraceae bacterium]
MKIRADDYFLKVEDITQDYLAAHNVRGIILDIDNTIMIDGETQMTATVSAWLSCIGLPVCLLSNGKECRVKMIADALGLRYISRAKKPFKGGYIKGAALLGIADIKNIAVIGDQMLSDIWGGKRAGCYTIKVEPIDPTADPITVKVKRGLEKWVTKESVYHNIKK